MWKWIFISSLDKTVILKLKTKHDRFRLSLSYRTKSEILKTKHDRFGLSLSYRTKSEILLLYFVSFNKESYPLFHDSTINEKDILS